jgi:CPA2 family monovalent cation:H+ antiporter-2
LAAWLLRNVRIKPWLKRLRRSRKGKVDEPVEPRHEVTPSPYRAVVVGYGPVGRTLVRLLQENEVEPTVIELNFDAVQRVRGQGIAGVYGDAMHHETLATAGVAESGTLILSASNLAGSAEVIRLAKELNPKIRVLARSAYVGELGPLKKAGADVVFSGEGEVALALTVAVLRELGATGEQIDRETERVRRELVDIRDGKTDHQPPSVPQQPSTQP